MVFLRELIIIIRDYSTSGELGTVMTDAWDEVSDEVLS